MKFWGAVAPIEVSVMWCGTAVPVEFRIADSRTELDILARAGDGPPPDIQIAQHTDQRDYLETYYRLCYVLHKIDGELLDEECRTFRDRLVEVASWLDPIIWELRDAYGRAKTLLLLEEHRILNDPLPEARPSAPSGDALPPPTTSPGAPSVRTRRRTSATTSP